MTIMSQTLSSDNDTHSELCNVLRNCIHRVATLHSLDLSVDKQVAERTKRLLTELFATARHFLNEMWTPLVDDNDGGGSDIEMDEAGLQGQSERSRRRSRGCLSKSRDDDEPSGNPSDDEPEASPDNREGQNSVKHGEAKKRSEYSEASTINQGCWGDSAITISKVPSVLCGEFTGRQAEWEDRALSIFICGYDCPSDPAVWDLALKRLLTMKSRSIIDSEKTSSEIDGMTDVGLRLFSCHLHLAQLKESTTSASWSQHVQYKVEVIKFAIDRFQHCGPGSGNTKVQYSQKSYGEGHTALQNLEGRAMAIAIKEGYKDDYARWLRKHERTVTARYRLTNLYLFFEVAVFIDPVWNADKGASQELNSIITSLVKQLQELLLTTIRQLKTFYVKAMNAIGSVYSRSLSG
ncbi:hypothetical protein NM688_g3705 [Phlebia brevispora]|uniref:Uncharacterized protein n=1 Tax=Phlebia brevispora TaxID=194682 RepID=A0ACC1T4Z4_9APHY|nr:hypothetical protein NM688_g3705 [Phlebia brevispora]